MDLKNDDLDDRFERDLDMEIDLDDELNRQEGIDPARSEASRYNEEEYLDDDQAVNDRKDDNHRVVN